MAMDSPTRGGDASRRAVIGGFVGLGVGVPLLAACGSDGLAGGSSDSAGGSGGTTSSGPIAKTSEIPVGGGKIFTREKVVVTQPTQGDFKAFSAICTHQQCVVTRDRRRGHRLQVSRQQVLDQGRFGRPRSRHQAPGVVQGHGQRRGHHRQLTGAAPFTVSTGHSASSRIC